VSFVLSSDKSIEKIKRKSSNCVDITIYEKNISDRLDIPTGSKRELRVRVPSWIMDNKTYIARYLRGLYETDGALAHHEKTYTHKLIFTNRNESLLHPKAREKSSAKRISLDDVFMSVILIYSNG